MAKVIKITKKKWNLIPDIEKITNETIKGRKFHITQLVPYPRDRFISIISINVKKEGWTKDDFEKRWISYSERLERFLFEKALIYDFEGIDLFSVIDHMDCVTLIIEIIPKKIVGEF